jgi:uncharacterized protein DUF5677
MTRELRQLCNLIQELAEKISKDVSRRTPNSPQQVVILFMFAKAYKSFRAALMLFRGGFSQDAVSLGRTILELMFQAMWLSRDSESAAILFLRGEERERRKLLDNLSRHGAQEIRGKVDRFSRELSKTGDIDLAWRNWWNKAGNIEQLARELGSALERTYQLKYRPMSWFIHSSPFSIKYFVPPEREDFAIEWGSAKPGKEDEAFAEMLFSAAHEGLLNIMAVTDTIYALERQADFHLVAAALMKVARKAA